MKQTHYRCAVIGDWHLAFNIAACISSLGHKTLLVNPLLNTDSQTWRSFPELPLNEPGLPEMISDCRKQGNLEYANGIHQEWTADLVWLAIDTPVNELDQVDTSPLLQVAEKIGRFKNCKGPFVISSQIPVGFSRKIQKIIGTDVVYVPENLRLGKGIETFKFADRTVIGSDSKNAREFVKEFLKGFQTQYLLCDVITAEMVKHATNAFLATSISFANEMALIGEQLGVDNITVGQALKMDGRIGKSAYVIPGLGFAGGTLPRDLRILQELGKELNAATPLTNAVLEINDSTAKSLVRSVRDYLGSLENKKILILGYAYKAETDTLRRSPAIDLAKELKKEKADIYGFDPMMNQRDLSPLQGLISHHSQWHDISYLPDAIIIMTSRKDFAQLDWSSLQKLAQHHPAKQSLIFDTQNMLSSETALRAGFAYKGLWKPILN